MAIPMYGQNRTGNNLDHGGHGVQVLKEVTTVLQAGDSGSTIVLINIGASATVKLPSPEDGMNFKFAYVGSAAEAQNWTIDTQSDTNYLLGGLPIIDTDATTDGAEALVPILPDGGSNSKMTLVTPDNGTWVHLVSDGTLWYCYGLIASATATAVVYADQ